MKHDDLGLDRRAFLVATSAMALAVAPLAQAVAAALPQGGAIAAARQAAPLLDDWTIDDMWGVYPRPHEAIGFGRPRGDGERVAAVHPADTQFLV